MSKPASKSILSILSTYIWTVYSINLKDYCPLYAGSLHINTGGLLSSGDSCNQPTYLYVYSRGSFLTCYSKVEAEVAVKVEAMVEAKAKTTTKATAIKTKAIKTLCIVHYQSLGKEAWSKVIVFSGFYVTDRQR